MGERKRKFSFNNVSKKPVLKRQTYDIPKSYLDAYEKAGITNTDEQMMLFHLTQFGGFKLKKIPQDMHYDRDFIRRWFKTERDKGYLHFKSNEDFISTFGRLDIQPLEKIWREKVLNYKDMKENGFSDEEIKSSIDFLTKLNKFYSSIRLNIHIPRSGITTKDRIELSLFHGIPYLVKKPRAGGRFFHPETSYQGISSSLRKFMTINGEKTSEIDLSASTLQFLNIGLEKHASESILETILSNGDPYDYFLSVLNSDEVLTKYREQLIDREDLKIVVYTAIYSFLSCQKNNVNQKLRIINKSYKHPDLVEYFPEFFNAISVLNKVICAKTSQEDVLLHNTIYKEESIFAQEVLQEGCLEKGMLIIPVHDSFITTASNTKNLKEIIDNAALRLYGRKLAYKRKY